MARANALVTRVITWYSAHARALPWRASDVSPWGILVSEFMLQQTQVERVIPKWEQWMRLWPTAHALAAASPADALRAWQGLGYPRRALRLHATAQLIVDQWQGQVPARESELLTLPGVGDYTAAAIAAFAFGQPTVVLDTNIRRVIARAWAGIAAPAGHLTEAERALAGSLTEEHRGAQWSTAVMELGALVCTARAPRCESCPLRSACVWLAAGRPANAATTSRRQSAFVGSDRQARGALLRAISASEDSSTIEHAWSDDAQRERALASLLADGLAARTPWGYALPGN